MEQITIVMPVYNSGKFLQPCLESLLRQSIKDFRIIAIDDCSTDCSWEILKKNALCDNRLMIMRNDHNIGAANTRNIGVKLARGKYIVFVDSDDYYEDDYLEVLLNACEDNALDIAICDFLLHDEQDKTCTVIKPNKRLLNVINKPFNIKYVNGNILQLFSHNPFIRMYRKKFLDDNDLLFQDLSNSNDVYLGQMALLQATNIMHISKVLVHYRYNTGMQITTNSWAKAECVYYAVKQLYDDICRRGIFQKVKRSFFSYVIDMAMLSLRSDYIKKEDTILQNWCSHWFRSLSMIDLNENMFSNYSRYFLYRAFFLEGKEVVNDQVAISERCCYEAFFVEVNKRKCRLAHWGYGKLGKKFCIYSQKCKYPLIEVYDKNAELWTNAAPIPVKSFSKRSCNVDMIVVTNAFFEDDIIEVTKAAGYTGKLFDFTAYCKGVDFSLCVF